ncbi:MAG TPA: hypothetical protein VF575_02505 [Candidatus Saccharimonadales bacterium]|jgi:uncharacterized membrane protein YwzB
MSKSAKNLKASTAPRHKSLYIVLALAFVVSLLIVVWTQHTVSQKQVFKDTYVTQSRLAYVDGTDAAAHVASFYKQYIDPRTPAANKLKFIDAYGNKNLLFYSQYYLHGFDPITCSQDAPTDVSTSLASTGPVATVNVIPLSPDADGTTETITARVVLDEEGLSIDSITCPGNKANLPPNS